MLFLRERFCAGNECSLLFFAESAGNGKDVCKQLIFLVEEACRDEHRASEALAGLKCRSVLALLILIDSGAGGELVDTCLDAELFLS